MNDGSTNEEGAPVEGAGAVPEATVEKIEGGPVFDPPPVVTVEDALEAVAPDFKIAHIAGPIEDYDALMQTPADRIDREDRDIVGTVTNTIMQLRDNPLTTTAAREIQQRVLDKPGAVFEQQQLKRTTNWKCNDNISGKNAMLAFTAYGRGVYRLPLYNTGIFIDLVPCKPSQLNAIFETVDQSGERVGAIIGDYQYMCYDAIFKEATLELLPLVVVNSNLKNWDRGTVLADSISANDYDAILWALSAMSVDRKLDIDLYCVKNECNTITPISYDYGRFHLLRNIPPAALAWIRSMPEMVDAKMLAEYANLLEFNGRTFDYFQKRITFKVPSLKSVVDNAKAILAEIESRVSDTPTYYNRKVLNELMLHVNNNFVPWIDSIVQLDDTGKQIFRTTDSKVFAQILDIHGVGDEHAPFFEAMVSYMADTRASVIGYQPMACPKCKNVHQSPSGFVAWDPERVFFETTYLTLARERILIGDV
jgi:hypothetical protein